MINLHMDNAAIATIVRGHYMPVTYLNDVPEFTAVPLGWILHVAQGDGSLYDMFNRNVPGARKFSTAWVGKNGRIEFYGSLFREPWAQVNGNADYWAVETEGYDTEPLTHHQLNSLARIHAALNIASGRNLNHLANHPGQVGIGTHSMGGKAWGGHSCPGSIRAAQRSEIITRAKRFHYVQKVSR